MKIVVPISGASLVAQMVKNLLSMQETQVWTLGQEDSLEKEMANHYSILAWRITWTEEPGGLPSMESQRVGHDWATNTHTHTHSTYLIGLLWRVNESVHIMLWSQCLARASTDKCFHALLSTVISHYHITIIITTTNAIILLTISIIPEWWRWRLIFWLTLYCWYP